MLRIYFWILYSLYRMVFYVDTCFLIKCIVIYTNSNATGHFKQFRMSKPIDRGDCAGGGVSIAGEAGRDTHLLIVCPSVWENQLPIYVYFK